MHTERDQVKLSRKHDRVASKREAIFEFAFESRSTFLAKFQDLILIFHFTIKHLFITLSINYHFVTLQRLYITLDRNFFFI